MHKRMRNTIIKLTFGFFGIASLTSCWWKASGDNPGIEYAPDMYYSKGYEPMTQFSDSSKYRYNPYFMTMRTPVEGTVAIGQMDYRYAYDNTPEGYEAAGLNLMMPTDLTVKEQKEGERLFGIYCAVCHGAEGGNDGSVSSKQVTLKPSWANLQDKYFKELPAGKIYHVITYGKNNMGSYAYALTPRERWAVISYAKRLSMKDSLGKIPDIVSNETNLSAVKVDIKAEAVSYDAKSELAVTKEQSDKLFEIFKGVEFETGSSNLKSSSLKNLDNLATYLMTFKDNVFVIKGHTDNTGDEDKNIALSDERAEAVKSYLISKGIAAESLLAIGFGSLKPIADNKTEEGKQKNRRVEIGFKKK